MSHPPPIVRLGAALAVASLVALGACSRGDKNEARSSTTRAGAATTTTLARSSTTSTAVGGPVPTADPNVGPTTAEPPATRQPSTGEPTSDPLPPSPPDPSVPQVSPAPERAPVGARVSVEGTGFTDEQWQGGGLSLWLSGSGGEGCALYAEAQHDIHVTPDGHLQGSFTVPATGECRQSDISSRPVQPGAYTLAFGCTACFIGRFDVTGS